MYSPTYISYESGMPEILHGILLIQADLDNVLRMFISTFGAQPLRDHPDLNRQPFYQDSIPFLFWWEMATALQIAVDITAACDDEDERVVRLKQHFRDLIGPCKNETLVRIQNIPFIVERPPAPF